MLLIGQRLIFLKTSQFYMKQFSQHFSSSRSTMWGLPAGTSKDQSFWLTTKCTTTGLCFRSIKGSFIAALGPRSSIQALGHWGSHWLRNRIMEESGSLLSWGAEYATAWQHCCQAPFILPGTFFKDEKWWQLAGGKWQCGNKIYLAGCRWHAAVHK